MSKVSTRAQHQGGSSSTTTLNGNAPIRKAAASGSSSSGARNGGAAQRRDYKPRVPPVEYRVETVMYKGAMTEVMTIEDTPPPVPSGSGVSGTTGSTSLNSRYESNGSQYSNQHDREPPAKKRRNDGLHISDQPYANSATYSNDGYQQQNGEGSSSNQLAHHHLPPPISSTSGSNGTLQKKRKLGGDAYDGYSGRDSATGARTSAGAKGDLPSADKEGHFIVRINECIGILDRYRIVRPLGQGTFGKVVCAYDADTKREVAIKIMLVIHPLLPSNPGLTPFMDQTNSRAVAKYREASKVEIKVLKLLRERDPQNEYKCIHSINVFDHKNHICIVSELLSSSVFDFLKDNSYQPFPFSQIQHFALQLLRSVEFLHGLNLIHTDLKPENILLETVDSFTVPVKPVRLFFPTSVALANSSLCSSTMQGSKKTKKILKNSNIRLIDFGSATFEPEYHATVVSTRHYRAPEIILGMGWSFPCDVWSIGCILIEFYTGEALFQTHENLEHLAMMQRVFGPMPEKFAQDSAKLHEEWFKKGDVSNGRGRRPNQVLAFPQADTSKQSKKFVAQMKTLKELIRPESGIEAQRFLSLLEGLLRWEPQDRFKVKEALKHPFFNLKMHDDGNSRF